MKELSQAVEGVFRSIGEKIESHTPVYGMLDKWFLSLDESTKNKLATELWYYSNQLGVGNGLKTQVGKQSIRRWFRVIRSGEKARFAEYSEAILDGFNFVKDGQENLDPDPGIFVSNHPSGPFQGTWYPYVIDNTVNQKLGLEKVPRWFLKEYSESYVFGETPLRHIKERTSQMMAQSNDMLLIQRDRSTFPPLLTQAKSHLESGGNLAICFEEHNNTKLTRSRPGVGLFLRTVTENGVFPIRPVGCWKNGDDLNVNFGKPVDIGEYLAGLPADITDKERSQRVIDHIAVGVARLIPEKHRGIYANLTK